MVNSKLINYNVAKRSETAARIDNIIASRREILNSAKDHKNI